jgi:hypothetical protein
MSDAPRAKHISAGNAVQRPGSGPRRRPSSWAPQRAREMVGTGVKGNDFSPAEIEPGSPAQSPKAKRASISMGKVEQDGPASAPTTPTKADRHSSPEPVAATDRRAMLMQRGPARAIKNIEDFKGRSGIAQDRLRASSAGGKSLPRMKRVVPDPPKATVKKMMIRIVAMDPPRVQKITFAAGWTYVQRCLLFLFVCRLFPLRDGTLILNSSH